MIRPVNDCSSEKFITLISVTNGANKEDLCFTKVYTHESSSLKKYAKNITVSCFSSNRFLVSLSAAVVVVVVIPIQSNMFVRTVLSIKLPYKFFTNTVYNKSFKFQDLATSESRI